MNAYEQLRVGIVDILCGFSELNDSFNVVADALADWLSERVTLNDQLEQVGSFRINSSGGWDDISFAQREGDEWVPVYRVRTEGNGE